MIDIDLKEFLVLYQHPDDLGKVITKLYEGGLDYLASYFSKVNERVNGRILFLKKNLEEETEIYSMSLPCGTFNLLELCRDKGYHIINGDSDLFDSN